MSSGRTGRPGRIGFAVSVPLHAWLREEIEATAPERWKPYGEDGGAVKECAVVNYYPQEEPENRYREPLRYIGIRIRRKQHDLLDGRREVLYFAVATNLSDWEPKRLLEWHRQ
jgi:hypothetical protein